MKKVDWSQFDDWLEYGGTDGNWPSIFESKELTEEQKQVVERNAELLLDRKAWQRRIEAFEEALANIKDKDKREEKLSKFCIHFDAYEFDRVENLKLTFLDYVFPCSVSFHSVDFGDGDVLFMDSNFRKGNVYFNNARFGDGEISFDKSKFGDGDIYFENSRFGAGIVSFTSAKFGFGLIDFGNLHFSSDTKFIALNMKVEGTFLFNSNIMPTASFNGMKANNDAFFVGCSFKECPDFRNADFGRPPEVAGMKVPPPEMKGEFFKTCPDGEAAPKYRKLKAMALAANDHDKDGEFFAYEMMAKRGHEITGFGELLANSFYYHVSYYGQSWIRPLFGVFISWFVFTLIYLKHVATILTVDSLNFSAVYSALNSFPFLSSLHRLTLKPKDYEGSLEKTLDTLATHDGVLDSILNWAMFQQFIGIVLLFFLLLGLRNRFRLK